MPSKFAFKFISGKYHGGEFPIPDDGELIIGRAAEVDIVLVEDMVSRKHARLVATGGELTITDLGSTNGTFVNGEKIDRTELHKDDRILLGTSILKVIFASDMRGTPSDRESFRQQLRELGERGSTTSQSMTGDLSEVPLPDLLQLFATNKKSGTLRIACGGSYAQAQLFVAEGHLQHVRIDGLPTIKAQKALSRLLALHGGEFEFTIGAVPKDTPQSLQDPTETSLIESMRLNDETARALGKLASGEHGFVLPLPLTPRLRDLSKDELDFLQLALGMASLQDIMDAYDGPDEAAVHLLLKLVSASYLTAR